MFDDLLSFNALLGASVGLIVIVASAVVYNYIHVPKVAVIAVLIAVVGIEICIAKAVIDSWEKRIEDDKRTSAKIGIPTINPTELVPATQPNPTPSPSPLPATKPTKTAVNGSEYLHDTREAFSQFQDKQDARMQRESREAAAIRKTGMTSVPRVKIIPRTPTSSPLVAKIGAIFRITHSALSDCNEEHPRQLQKFSDSDSCIAIIGEIQNSGESPMSAKDWSAFYKTPDGNEARGNMIAPMDGSELFFRSSPTGTFTRKREDWLPVKLEGKTIPQGGGYYYGFLLFCFPGISKDQFNPWFVTLKFKDGKGVECTAIPTKDGEERTWVIGVNPSFQQPPISEVAPSPNGAPEIPPFPRKQPIGLNNRGRSFEVLSNGGVGSWLKGQIFTEFDFRVANPAPAPHSGLDAAEQADHYYEGIINRLIGLNAIRVV